MKKLNPTRLPGQKILLFAFAFSITTMLQAQNTFPATGNVGVGTITPSQKLEVNGSVLSTSNYGLIISPPIGDAVIKRGNPGMLAISSNGGSSDVRINYNYGGGSGGLTVYDGGTANNANFKVNPSGHLSIFSSGGNIGIGTVSPAWNPKRI